MARTLVRQSEYCALCGSGFLHGVHFVNGDPRPGPLPLRWRAEARVGKYLVLRVNQGSKKARQRIYSRHQTAVVLGSFCCLGFFITRLIRRDCTNVAV